MIRYKTATIAAMTRIRPNAATRPQPGMRPPPLGGDRMLHDWTSPVLLMVKTYTPGSPENFRAGS